ncbi:uncharacterized protein LOC6560861 [Drosophila grimshawi]|uniref:uncharacterized protein LOC6560861 n=1 Tax=Drosophila grimshawi TaxID=7222 RepID=UPI000C86E5FE|nr:uncharacterized protein LOC6560861 [Drosophila grimshawi]
MKFLIIAVAFLACAFADVSELGQSGYDYPQPAPPAPAPEYIPPAAPAPEYIPPAAPVETYIPPQIEEIEQPAQDGYRYKTVRRRVFRHRN